MENVDTLQRLQWTENACHGLRALTAIAFVICFK